MFCVSLKVKLTVPLLCVCVHSAWKGRPRNDLYRVGRDVKPYSLTHCIICIGTQYSTVFGSCKNLLFSDTCTRCYNWELLPGSCFACTLEQESRFTWSRWLCRMFLCFHMSCMLFIWCTYDICLCIIDDSGVVAGWGGLQLPPRLLEILAYRKYSQSEICGCLSLSENCNFLPHFFNWQQCWSMRSMCKRVEVHQRHLRLHQFPILDCFFLTCRISRWWVLFIRLLGCSGSLSLISHSHFVIIPPWSLDLFAKLFNLNTTCTAVTVCQIVFFLQCWIVYRFRLQLKLPVIGFC